MNSGHLRRRAHSTHALVAFVTSIAGCAPPVANGASAAATAQPTLVSSALHRRMKATDGHAYTLDELVTRHEWTVVLFYSDTCPTVKAHDERINALTEHYGSQRVGFYWVDSEAGASLARDTNSARERRYMIPILIDEGAHVADALGARYASHSFIFNNHGEVVYSGGIDSDKRDVHPNATPYLARALDAVLSGATPAIADGRALGCALAR